jgi:hypothetical protein
MKVKFKKDIRYKGILVRKGVIEDVSRCNFLGYKMNRDDLFMLPHSKKNKRQFYYIHIDDVEIL